MRWRHRCASGSAGRATASSRRAGGTRWASHWSCTRSAAEGERHGGGSPLEPRFLEVELLLDAPQGLAAHLVALAEVLQRLLLGLDEARAHAPVGVGEVAVFVVAARRGLLEPGDLE